MRDLFGLNRKRKLDEILNIESMLQSSLKPVSPRPEFIKNLEKGLMDYTFPQEENLEFDLKKALIFAFLGLAGLVLFFSLWIRLIVVIISAMGMIQSSRQKRLTH